MKWTHGMRARLHLLRRGEAEERMDEEIRFHLEMEVEKYLREGMSPEEARRRAVLAFGGVEGHKEEMREGRSALWLDSLIADARYAVRTLRRSPGLLTTVVLTLALGIGATAAVFSLIDATLLRPLPVHEPERLVHVEMVREGGATSAIFSYPRYTDFREGVGSLSGVAAYGWGEVGLSTGGSADVAAVNLVSGNYFATLGIRPAAGRLISPVDDRAGNPAPAAVVSHALWKLRFGADPGVIGRTVQLNGQGVTIVGVAPQGFAGLDKGSPVDLWLPIALYPQLSPGADIYERGRRVWLTVFGRLAPGVTREQAEAAVRGLPSRLPEELAFLGAPRAVRLHPLTGHVIGSRGETTAFLGLLLGAAGLVLLIASVNVASILLARATARRREIAIRLAMGGGRGRIARQLLTESLLLSLVGAAAGVLLAVWLVELTPALLRLPVPVSVDATLSLRLLAFVLLLALGTGILFGLAPALEATRATLTPAFRQAPERGGGRTRLRSVLVAGQVSMALLLLVSAGLFVRAVREALAIDLGFEPSGVLTARIDVAPHEYGEARREAFYRELLARVEALPKVESASLAATVPLGGQWMQSFVSLDQPRPSHGDTETSYNVVGPDYFRTMRIPLVAGRAFTVADHTGAAAAAVVNETFSHRVFPGQDPIGQRFYTAAGEVEVVGLARDGKYHELREDPQPFFYLSYGGTPWDEMTLHVRTVSDPSRLLPQLRAAVEELDPHVPLYNVSTFDEMIGRRIAPQRTGAAAIGALGLAGLVLAAVGLYGVLSYAVGRRTHEIGVRLALGAQPERVLRMVLRQGLSLALAGIAVGIVAALAATRLLESLLFGVSPLDPLTFALVTLLLAGVALLASFLPARRATRVDPMVALRSE
jgi:predicted permease